MAGTRKRKELKEQRALLHVELLKAAESHEERVQILLRWIRETPYSSSVADAYELIEEGLL